GETGSGKSIIVDSLGALTGDRVSSDLIKEGEHAAHLEGLFSIASNKELRNALEESGIETETRGEIELIIRRELSRSGKNRIFVNNQLATVALLKRIGTLLVDIHGQGEQATLFDASTHISFLDEYGRLEGLQEAARSAFRHWNSVRTELSML